MELQLKNVGMIKEANVKIDGLTVIAGENDTGKSTVGKALFFIKEFKYLAKAINLKEFISDDNYNKILKDIKDIELDINKLDKEVENVEENIQSLSEIMPKIQKFINKFDNLEKVSKTIEKLRELSSKELEKVENKEKYNRLNKEFVNFFYFPMTDNTKINLKSKEYNIKFGEKIFSETKTDTIDTYPSIFIETPIIINFVSFLSKLDTIQNEIKYNITNYPYIFRSLYKQLKLELKEDSTLEKDRIVDDLKNIIKGEFKFDDMGKLVFQRGNKIFDSQSVATGIKTFGILQILIKNNHLTKKSILILDEPEVHLHPKWQLEMAKIIVELVKNGVKILVNSHSPYMIQALIKYARDEDIVDKSNFYLTRKDEDYAIIDNVNNELNKIFELLAEPMNEVFEL